MDIFNFSHNGISINNAIDRSYNAPELVRSWEKACLKHFGFYWYEGLIFHCDGYKHFIMLKPEGLKDHIISLYGSPQIHSTFEIAKKIRVHFAQVLHQMRKRELDVAVPYGDCKGGKEHTLRDLTGEPFTLFEGGTWYPSKKEKRHCCLSIKKGWHYDHCLSAEHIAQLAGVNPKLVTQEPANYFDPSHCKAIAAFQAELEEGLY